MSNSTTNLDLISTSQSDPEVTANALFDAGSPAMIYGRRAAMTAALTWGYYGGMLDIAGVPTAIANGTIALSASATNYVEANPATGAVSKNTTAFTSGYLRLYTVVTGASTVISYTDHRTPGIGASGGGGGAVTLVAGEGIAIEEDPADTFTISASGGVGFGGALSTFIWGNGEDGSADLDGVNSYGWASYSSNVYSLTRSVMLDDLTIQPGITLNPAGFRLLVAGTLDNDGTISVAGANATSGTGANPGGSGGAAVFGGASAGGGGGNNSNGTAGSALTSGSAGGAGGAGGNATPNTGGAGGAQTTLGASHGNASGVYAFSALMNGLATGTGSVTITGGSGGGGGASAAPGDLGGGGGGGAGVMAVIARAITGGGTITAKGGNGHTVTGGVSRGGGGGGGGGVIFVVTTTANYAALNTVTVAGGTGGSGDAGGTNGANGAAGRLVELIL